METVKINAERTPSDFTRKIKKQKKTPIIYSSKENKTRKCKFELNSRSGLAEEKNQQQVVPRRCSVITASYRHATLPKRAV